MDSWCVHMWPCGHVQAGFQTYPRMASMPQMIFKSLLRHRLLRVVIRNSPHGFHATDDIQVSLETQAAKSSDQKRKKSIWRQDAEAPGPGGNPTNAGRVSVTPATFSGHML